jgi:hypothetical protein
VLTKKKNIYAILYYILLILWLSVQILSTSEIKQMLPFDLAYVSNRLLVLVILIQFLNLKLVKKDLMLAILILIGVLVYLSTRNVTIFSLAVLIFGARNLELKRTIKICFSTQVFWVILIVLLSIVGVIDNTVYLRNGQDPTSARYALGFYYSTFVAHYFFSIIIEYIYLKKEEKLSIFEIVSILFINTLLYGLTDTKAVFYSIIVLILVIALNNFKPQILNSRVVKYFSVISFPLFTILIFLLSYFYNPNNLFLSKLNNALSDRLRLGNEGFERLDFTLFGQTVDFATRKQENDASDNFKYFFIDSSYLNIFFTLGVVALLVILIIYTWNQIYLIKNNFTFKYLALGFLALHSFADPQLVDLSYNLLLFTPLLIFQEYKKGNANQVFFSYEKLNKRKNNSQILRYNRKGD